MSAKREAKQREAEQRILQYKAVIEYLRTKTDVAAIPRSNQVCIENVLLKGGWKLLGGSWAKGGQSLDLIRAGIKEFGDQYDRLKREHLKTTVQNFMEGKPQESVDRFAKPNDP
jgi:hypothetical protein